MIADIEAKKINLIVTKDLSRLGRDYIQTGYYIEKYFAEKRVRYISLLDGIDTGRDNAINDITPFKAILDDLYAKDISKKIKSVKRDKQKKGLFIGGKAPYGYQKHPTEQNRIAVDEEAAEIVRKIFSYATEGMSCRRIAKELNRMGIPTPSAYAGKARGCRAYAEEWSAERISYMLKNEVYIGNMVQGRVQKISYKSNKCIRLGEEFWTVIENTHEPIIEKDTFAMVQRLLQSRKHSRERVYEYWLKGMVFCQECGRQLGVVHRNLAQGRECFYFVCRTYQRSLSEPVCTNHMVREEKIRELAKGKILQLLEQSMEESDYLAQWEKAKREVYEAGRKVCTMGKNAAKDQEALTKKMNQLYLEHLDGIIEQEDFMTLYEKMKLERKKLEKSQQWGHTLKLRQMRSGTPIQNWIQKFQDGISENRELLASLFLKITISEHAGVQFYYRFANPEKEAHVPLAIPDVSRIEKKALKKLSQEMEES